MATAVGVMVIAAAALIVDHNWLVDQRDVMKSASDAAAVAATLEMNRPAGQDKCDNEDEMQTHLEGIAENYVSLNLAHLSGDRLTQARDTLKVDVTPQCDPVKVDVTASADLGGTLFSRHLPVVRNYEGPATVGALAKVESYTRPVEVVLAIDVSRSMEAALDGTLGRSRTGESRMEIVKRAAKDLVDILEPAEGKRVAVGVVPWQVVVRLDETVRDDWATNDWAVYPTSRHYGAPYRCTPANNCTVSAEDQSLPSDPGEAWLGCLDEHRVDAPGYAALPPESDLLALPADISFAQAIYTSLQGRAYDCAKPPLPSNYRSQDCYSADVATTGMENVWQTSSFPAQNDCKDDMPPIRTLSSDPAEIEAAIDALAPVGERTYSALGVLWAKRLLMHEWKDVWSSGVEPVDPEAEGNADNRKVIVLLTDGEDNPCGMFDPHCETNDVGLARDSACSAAKAAGAEIFVVAAMAPEYVSSTLETSLRACSSEADNPDGTYVFINNSERDGLEQAFADIARQLQSLRRVY